MIFLLTFPSFYLRHMTQHVNDSPAKVFLFPLLNSLARFSWALRACFLCLFSNALVMLHAALGRPATTETTPSPFCLRVVFLFLVVRFVLSLSSSSLGHGAQMNGFVSGGLFIFSFACVWLLWLSVPVVGRERGPLSDVVVSSSFSLLGGVFFLAC